MNEHLEEYNFTFQCLSKKTTYFFAGVLNIDLACFNRQESNVQWSWQLMR